MIIDISSKTEATGHKKYIFHGTKGERDISKVVHVEGDYELAEEVMKQMTRKKKSMTFVISVSEEDTHVDDEMMKQIYNEVMDNIFVGMNREDIIVCAAIHNDTKQKHVHVQVVDNHLLTNQPLDLYLNSVKSDRERYFAIRDVIEHKYNLRSTMYDTDVPPLPPIKSFHWEKWRKDSGLKDFVFTKNSFNFKTKKSRKESQGEIQKFVVQRLSSVDENGDFGVVT